VDAENESIKQEDLNNVDKGQKQENLPAPPLRPLNQGLQNTIVFPLLSMSPYHCLQLSDPTFQKHDTDCWGVAVKYTCYSKSTLSL